MWVSQRWCTDRPSTPYYRLSLSLFLSTKIHIVVFCKVDVIAQFGRSKFVNVINIAKSVGRELRAKGRRATRSEASKGIKPTWYSWKTVGRECERHAKYADRCG